MFAAPIGYAQELVSDALPGSACTDLRLCRHCNPSHLMDNMVEIKADACRSDIHMVASWQCLLLFYAFRCNQQSSFEASAAPLHGTL